MKGIEIKKFWNYSVVVLVLFFLGGLTTACTDYQDEVDSLDRRVTALEELMKKANSRLEEMQVVFAAIEEGDFITSVRDTENGYVVNFKKAGAVYLYDGKDGQDAQMPEIDVMKDDDGYFYWVINGVPLKDSKGNPVRVNGKDGKDGVDGKDGKDGVDGKDAVAPQVRINTETLEWEISIDGGKTWTPSGTSSQGKDGNQFFKSVSTIIQTDEQGVMTEYMVIVTVGGSTYYIPIYRG
jgi:hypothetical protein